MFRSLPCLLLAALLLAGGSVRADQARIPSFSSAKQTYFYDKLYREGGQSLYCGVPFGPGEHVSIEHVLPAERMKEAAGCEGLSREQCRGRSRRFNRMEADLHNLWPALPEVNNKRGSLPFGEIPGEEWDFPACDFEVEGGKVEPRPQVRGEIARSIFYMMREYGVRLPDEEVLILWEWNRADPPDEIEGRRNGRIAALQGTRNPFIDDPAQADLLVFGMADRSRAPRSSAAPAGTATSPRDCRIKGNISGSGRIYHVPGGRDYARTKIEEAKGERWFCSEEEARAAGWRPPKR